MKIFISWSGTKSKKAAQVLRSWLPDVIQNIEPWMSSTDIDAGSRWSRDIEEQLQHSNFGIICLTRSNAVAPWINFEAGAIAKSVANSSVCPYLLDLKPSQIPRGPLNLFQSKVAERNQTWELLLSINKAMNGDALTEQQLIRTFDRWWPDLKQALANLPQDDEVVADVSEEQAMFEILDTVRSISRKLQRDDMEKNLIRILRAATNNIKTDANSMTGSFFHSNKQFTADQIEKLVCKSISAMNFDEFERLYKDIEVINKTHKDKELSDEDEKSE